MMKARSIAFKTSLKKFADQGEKTGWTYFEVPVDLSQELVPGNRKGYKVKGKIDKHPISGVSTIPMGGGRFIIAVNATIRKAIGKKHGSMIEVVLQEDKSPFVFNADFYDLPGR